MEWFVPEWLVALAVTLFALDLFITTEVLSWFGVVALSSWLTWRVGAPLKWSIPIFLGSLLVFAALYYVLLRTLLGGAVRRIMVRGAPKETVDRIVGATGTVRVINGKILLSWDGELWPVVETETPLAEGTKVRVDAMEGGLARISPV